MKNLGLPLIILCFFFIACKKDKSAPIISVFSVAQNASYEYGDTLIIQYGISDCGKQAEGLDQVLFELRNGNDLMVQGSNSFSACEVNGVFRFVLNDKYFPSGSATLKMEVTDKAGNQNSQYLNVNYTTLKQSLTHWILANGSGELRAVDTSLNAFSIGNTGVAQNIFVDHNSQNIITIPVYNGAMQVYDLSGNQLNSVLFTDSTFHSGRYEQNKFWVLNEVNHLRFYNHLGNQTSPGIWNPFTSNYRIRKGAITYPYIAFIEEAGGQSQLRINYLATALKQVYTLGTKEVFLGGWKERFMMIENEVSGASLYFVDPEQSALPLSSPLNFRVQDLWSNGSDRALIWSEGKDVYLLDNGGVSLIGNFELKDVLFDEVQQAFFFAAGNAIYQIQNNTAVSVLTDVSVITQFSRLYNK